jgi:hypothetical protein
MIQNGLAVPGWRAKAQLFLAAQSVHSTRKIDLTVIPETRVESPVLPTTR